MAEQIKTFGKLANHLGVSRRSIETWRERNDWPARRANGSFDLEAVDSFCQRHQLGRHNPHRNGETDAAASSLKEATLRKTFEQAENERIRKERALVEQAAELQTIVYATDVEAFEAEQLAIIQAVHDALEHDVREALPEIVPTAPGEWVRRRERVMQLAAELPSRVYRAVMEGES